MRPHVSGFQRTSPGRRARGRWSAFTLLEVLVAITIFAVAAVALGSSYLNVLNSYEAVSRGVVIGEDFAFARQRILSETDREKVEEGGEFDTASGRRARWSAVIEATNLPDLFTVVFTCEISELNTTEPTRLVQTFRVLRPTWSTDAAEQGELKEEWKTRIHEIQGKERKPI